jgi:hypothetical protein
MNDTRAQTGEGKVLWHFTMSLDGFVAGPNHEMDWMAGTNRPDAGQPRWPPAPLNAPARCPQARS